ncbi:MULTISPECIES: MFS transporter [unclassified Bacillus (in: firmicutes)]|uniref:MFS transporter n=1 Tax=unclassified Bacillus (in: firmicutes) TaxID=185979 RepID=UPI0008EC68F2|nr:MULTISPECIES: MFS transporter [unclassified Bacillus (in: firmicutes)]SFA88146.1 Predicted arabinose efflux permease, MFS family [Bacillus sp. UNCCL13]SFQ84520.1 Predicted arabinose efflux permease, MFS family [Bacillus sp. cl95]
MSVNTLSACEKSTIKNKSLTMLLLTSLVLTIGNKVYEIVLPLMMYHLTSSPIAMTTMRTAELLPNFLFGVFIGVLVDRVNKKKWVLTMTAIQAVLLFIMAFLFKTENTTMYLYYMIGFLLMTFNYGYFNAQVSITKLSVPTSQLTSANAKFNMIETMVSVMGPALSGLMFIFSDISNGILFSGIAYMVCVVLLSQIQLSSEPLKPKEKFVNELEDGWKAFIGNEILWKVTIFIIFINCSMIVVSTTVIFFAMDELKLSSSMLAIVLSFSGIGGGLGSLYVSKLRMKYGIGAVLGFSFLLSALAYLLLFSFPNVPILCLSLFVNGMSICFYVVTSYTIRHEQTPSHLIGRIAGITGTLYRVCMPIAMYFAGPAMVKWGSEAIFLTAAAWNIIIFLVYKWSTIWGLK